LVKIVGADRHSLRLGVIATKAPEAVWKELKRGSLDVLQTGNQLMSDSPRTGRIYKRGAITHQASAPGEPPAIDTGRLVASGKTGANESAKIATASWATEYAAPLEFGTSKMAERPFAAPALAIEKPKILNRVTVAVNKATRT
jgi:hypothetical protein